MTVYPRSGAYFGFAVPYLMVSVGMQFALNALRLHSRHVLIETLYGQKAHTFVRIYR